VLARFGNDERARLVVLQPRLSRAYSAKLAPLAGGLSGRIIGRPMWFMDSPEVRRFREAVTETAGSKHAASSTTPGVCSITGGPMSPGRVDAGTGPAWSRREAAAGRGGAENRPIWPTTAKRGCRLEDPEYRVTRASTLQTSAFPTAAAGGGSDAINPGVLLGD